MDFNDFVDMGALLILCIIAICRPDSIIRVIACLVGILIGRIIMQKA